MAALQGAGEFFFTVIVSSLALTFLIFFITGKRSDGSGGLDQKTFLDELRASREERRHTENYQWTELRDMVTRLHEDLNALRQRADEPRLVPDTDTSPGISLTLEPMIHDLIESVNRHNAIIDERHSEKMERRRDMDFKWIELRDAVLRIQGDLQEHRQAADESRMNIVDKPSVETVLEELHRQTAENRELFNANTESLRNDFTRGQEESTRAVKEAMRENVPFNMETYLDQFTKSLASEVRLLMGELGQLREQRRSLMHELGYLFSIKTKYGPTGDFEPDWPPTMPWPGAGTQKASRPAAKSAESKHSTPKSENSTEIPSTDQAAPKSTTPDTKPPSPLPMPSTDSPNRKDLAQYAAPGWRSVPLRKRKGKREKEKPRETAKPPGPGGSSALGLIVPKSDDSSKKKSTSSSSASSWATWQPDPSSFPSPPTPEPIIVVPDRSSPGLFGPRSPADSE